MNWIGVVEKNRKALIGVALYLRALLGDEDHAAIPLQKHVYLLALRILLPAESALRRLIFIAAREMSVTSSTRRAMPVGVLLKAERDGLTAFALFDRRVCLLPSPRRKAGCPRLTFIGDGLPPLPDSAARRVDREALARRVAVLQRALERLPHQAKRLARWQARKGDTKRPMRPGRPPGTRQVALYPVDRLLAELQSLALMADAPDTS